MSTELTKPSAQLQGKTLTDLDDLQVKFSGLISGAKKNFEEKIAPIEWSPETKAGIETYRDKLKLRKKELNEARSQYTKGFTAITAIFTAMEKDYDALVARVDAKEVDWKRAEKARQDRENFERAAKVKYDGAKLTIMPEIEKRLTEWVQEKKLEFLESLAAGNAGAIVKMEDATWQAICKSAVTFIGATEFVNDLGSEIVKPKKDVLWKKTDTDLQEFRMMANKTAKGGPEAIKKLQETMGVVFQEEAGKAEAAAEQAHDTALINEAVAATPIASGPAIKTKFIAAPQNTAEMLRVFNYFIQSMITDEGEANTLAWMQKNLGPAITKATRDANNGTKIKDVTYVEDVK
jgi:cell fate (sporulation/competence/biofilm development) regulator YmcA (YheA/YmcA/DUF963 family)